MIIVSFHFHAFCTKPVNNDVLSETTVDEQDRLFKRRHRARSE